MADNEGMSYPSNSYKSKEAIKPVAHGKPVIKKKTLKQRFEDLIFEPADGDCYDYVYQDILKPAFFDMLWDISRNILDAMQDAVSTTLFGSAKRARGRGYRTSYDDYEEYWNRERRGRRRERERDEDRRRSRRSDDVAAKVESRGEAIDLVEAMQNRIRQYKVASVLNFYDLAEMPTRSTDDDYGWDIAHPFEARIERVRDGYIVEPCSPIWLDR